MKVDGRDLRTIWLDPDAKTVKIIDQRRLPHELVLVDLHSVDDIIAAIKDMAMRFNILPIQVIQTAEHILVSCTRIKHGHAGHGVHIGMRMILAKIREKPDNGFTGIEIFLFWIYII